MKIVSPGRPLDTGAQPEALIKEARRRQRRRWLVSGAAVAVVLAGVAGMAAAVGGYRSGRAGPRYRPRSPAAARRAGPAPIPRSIGTTLVMWPVGYPAFGPSGGPGVYIDDLSTGRLTQSQQPAIGAGDYQPLLAQVGRWLVYVGNGTTAIRDNLSGSPHLLGSTPFFAPSATPGEVWLFRVEHWPSGPIQAWQVPVAGGPSGPRVSLPASATLPAVMGTDAGLLLQAGRGLALALWRPGSALRVLPYSPDLSDGFAATPRLVAYGTGCSAQGTATNAPHDPDAGYYTCQVLRVLDVVTGKMVWFPAPAGTGGWVPGGFDSVSAISPQNQAIAAYAALEPQGNGRVGLYVLRIGGPSRTPTRVPSSAAFLFARTAWSADGGWLLYQGPGGHLWAYQVASGQTRASITPCCQYTVMAAAPSSGGPS